MSVPEDRVIRVEFPEGNPEFVAGSLYDITVDAFDGRGPQCVATFFLTESELTRIQNTQRNHS